MKQAKPKTGAVTVALAGNPNVGKSTLFNRLTGMRQHTGNWAGKTVEIVNGCKTIRGVYHRFIDLPGTYSLSARSPEEEIARDFIASGEADVICVVCDGTCLLRNLHLALEAMRLCGRVAVCVNLADEALKKGVRINEKRLRALLGVPVCLISARKGTGMEGFYDMLAEAARAENAARADIAYPQWLEDCVKALEAPDRSRAQALQALETGDERALSPLTRAQKTPADARDAAARALHNAAKRIVDACVKEDRPQTGRAVWADRLLTGKFTALPIMLLMLGAVFLITIRAANVPSAYLSSLFARAEPPIRAFLTSLGASEAWLSMLVDGVYRVLTWVVAVMLPPMAIFFPLFALLEESGVLTRIAFNLDGVFQKCRACGKQGLTMCMGFGCNAVGISGARIIDSPRERLLAILTNSIVPCNGRFPTLIALISLFFASGALGASALLTGVIAFSIAVTFFMSWLLSKTALRGVKSFFTMELPPYRRPQYARVILTSLFTRAFSVLMRAVLVAAPAGAAIWALANLQFNGVSLIAHMTRIFDPVGRALGMDGALVCAFLLSLPANEILLPVTLMIYLASGTLVEAGEIGRLGDILVQNGWTAKTAACVCAFSLMHWPCSTALLTIIRETKSLKWTFMSILTPLVPGCAVCLFINWAF